MELAADDEALRTQFHKIQICIIIRPKETMGFVRVVKKIIWSDSFSVGNAEMDAQHQKIIAMINDLIDAQTSQELPTRLHQALHDMFLYSRNHLSDEEALLRDLDFPDLDAHIAEHEEYIERMATLSLAASSNETITSLEVIQFLRSWWQQHILHEDMKYAGLFK